MSPIRADFECFQGAEHPVDVRLAPNVVERRFGSMLCGEIRGIMGAKDLLTPTS